MKRQTVSNVGLSGHFMLTDHNNEIGLQPPSAGNCILTCNSRTISTRNGEVTIHPGQRIRLTHR